MYSDLLPKANSIFSSLPPTTKGYIQEYIQHQITRKLSPYTITSAINSIKQFFEHLSQDKKGDISLISKHDVRGFIESLSNRHLSSGTINTYLGYLRPFFAYMVDEDYVLKNPVLRRYYVIKETRLPRPMDDMDLRKFLEVLRLPRDRAMFLLMLRCGLRIGEVTKLQISDIHWVNKTIKVYNGKGRVDRMVYFSQDAEVALCLWWQSVCNNDSSYCFPSHRGARNHVGSAPIRQRLYHLRAECGVDNKGYTQHCLRHSFATSLLNAGIPLPIHKDLMGHTTFDQTLMYAKLSDQKSRDSYGKAMDLVQQEFALFKENAGGLPSSL